jgi:hypothetical protein
VRLRAAACSERRRRRRAANDGGDDAQRMMPGRQWRRRRCAEGVRWRREVEEEKQWPCVVMWDGENISHIILVRVS